MNDFKNQWTARYLQWLRDSKKRDRTVPHGTQAFNMFRRMVAIKHKPPSDTVLRDCVRELIQHNLLVKLGNSKYMLV